MVVGFIKIKIRIFGINSLKEKRSLVKRILNSVRSHFNVSAIEGDMQDSKQYICLGISMVNLNYDLIYNTMEKIENFLETQYTVEDVIREVYG
ncbi:DUF503 domain-containing protein [Thermosipho ferrireducens]|uniref:DUF503 domain-containing protein n=1 Tax=Thermosipho ferrireducens TaxID=2571116 RepID=A0ABX7S5L0_9BACT|nr:DUF503 domain-containing protein [Thermosipho ferrireducens]QTA37103.1 DUF503 domain-containing protein [Thermosipho ferrireducens]